MVRRIEAVRRQFELDWLSRGQVEIGDYLAEFSVEHRPAVRAQLAAAELMLRRKGAIGIQGFATSQISVPDRLPETPLLSVSTSGFRGGATPPTIAIAGDAESPPLQIEAAAGGEPTIELTPLLEELPTAMTVGAVRVGAPKEPPVRKFGDYEIIREIA